MIFNYRQFINWREEPDPPKPKPKKVPFSVKTGRPIDPHSPAEWMTYQEAAATGALVGFVFTSADPFYFLDLDDCLMPNGQWSPEALAVCNLFAGTAVEVSRSGTGLHIVGSCDKSQLTDRKHKFSSPAQPDKKWLEFYVDGRFMALGQGFAGDFNQDGTERLAGFVPIQERIDVDLTSGPVADYTGPADDVELISKMMNARGGAGAAFGTKATFHQLWTGDAQALAQVFPSPSGDAFDRSAADAALMAHLAFWTGKDAARMDRLFRQSNLMRAKYAERFDGYAFPTIKNAVAGCKAVYNIPRAGAVQGMPEPSMTGDEYLNTHQLDAWFAGCIYVGSMHRVSIPTGDFLKPETFDVWYGGKQFQMTPDGSKPTTSAFEAFTKNRVKQFPRVRDICFRPLSPSRSMIGEKLNVYIPDPQPAKAGDPTPFLDLLRRLLPDETDRTILLSWMAALVQNPGKKFLWTIVLQGVEGNGKSFVWAALERAIGDRYSHIANPDDLTNKFNGYIENKLLIGVEEIHMSGRREVLDTLKPLITNARVEIQNKGAEKRMIDNAANWFFLTNHRDAVIKTKNDRRYCIFFTAQQHEEDLRRDRMDGDYFPTLWNWARDHDGFAIIHDFLKRYQIDARFNPADKCHRAPETSTTASAIEETKGRAEQEIENAIANEELGFIGGWLSSHRVDALLRDKGIKMTRTRMRAMLEALGYREAFRATRGVMLEDNKRPVLYARKVDPPTVMTLDAYEKAQGYGSSNVIEFRR